MPITAACAIRMLRTELAGDTPPTYSATKMGLVTDTTGSQAPTATAAGNPITGDPRIDVGAWDAGSTASGVSAIKNTAAFSFTSMPAVPSPGVTHFNLYDSGGTPFRKVYGNLSAARITAAGDTLTFSAGSLSTGMVTSQQNTASV